MHKRLLATALATAALAPAAGFLNSFTSDPLAEPIPLPEADLVPMVSAPQGMDVIAIATGVNHRSAAAAYRGGSFFDKRDFAMAGTLVKHPEGDLLIDTGFGRNIKQQFAQMPWWFRKVTHSEYGKPAIDQLQEVGYDLASLRGTLLTHSHWDHVSGLPDFPGKPAFITSRELQFAQATGNGQLDLGDVDWQIYDFEGGPYLGFPRSHDFYGDGSIVVVPAPGHTLGGVVIFVTLPNGVRYAFIGDLVWQLEGVRKLEERPWFYRRVADLDPEGTRENLLRIRAIKDRFPEMIIVAAHDQRSFTEMNTLVPVPRAADRTGPGSSGPRSRLLNPTEGGSDERR